MKRHAKKFQELVCEKVQQKGRTTYEEVASELVQELTSNRAILGDVNYDEKSIRRRIYDALNVLMALDIITKEKKDIRWMRLPRKELDCLHGGYQTRDELNLAAAVESLKINDQLLSSKGRSGGDGSESNSLQTRAPDTPVGSNEDNLQYLPNTPRGSSEDGFTSWCIRRSGEWARMHKRDGYTTHQSMRRSLPKEIAPDEMHMQVEVGGTNSWTGSLIFSKVHPSEQGVVVDVKIDIVQQTNCGHGARVSPYSDPLPAGFKVLYFKIHTIFINITNHSLMGCQPHAWPLITVPDKNSWPPGVYSPQKTEFCVYESNDSYAYFVNHDSAPNSLIQSERDEYNRMWIVTTRKVNPGEFLSIAYSNDEEDVQRNFAAE